MLYIVGKIGSGRKTAINIIKSNFPQEECEIVDGVGCIYDMVDEEKKFHIIYIESATFHRYCRKWKNRDERSSLKAFQEVDIYMDEVINILHPVSDFVVKNNDTLENFKIQMLSIVRKIVDKNKGVKE